jgi:hypothetical protein
MGTSDRVRAGRDTRGLWQAEKGSEPARAAPSYWPQKLTDAVLAEASGRSLGLRGADDGPLWERWFERAIEQGVQDDLANLGRSVIREAREHGWNAARSAECGWIDDGEAMLELAVADPMAAYTEWQQLLDEL